MCWWQICGNRILALMLHITDKLFSKLLDCMHVFQMVSLTSPKPINFILIQISSCSQAWPLWCILYSHQRIHLQRSMCCVSDHSHLSFMLFHGALKWLQIPSNAQRWHSWPPLIWPWFNSAPCLGTPSASGSTLLSQHASGHHTCAPAQLEAPSLFWEEEHWGNSLCWS